MRERLRSKSNVEVLTADTTALKVNADFDRVLADVPCSGTGTLARHPEIKWRLAPDELRDFQGRQVAILQAALSKSRHGGRVVYSTCSLEPEENEQVVEQVLRESTIYELISAKRALEELRSEGEFLLADFTDMLDGEFLRLLPGQFSTDGFFAAIIERTR
jgi:16S rRNA (cytosine967-C5)-methyltransferase